MSRARKRGSRPARGRKGSAMVESALLLVVFLALFIGLLDIGSILFIHQTLIDRARNAARWGAVNPFDAASVQNLVLYGTTSAGATPSFGLSAANVIVTRPSAGIGTPDDRVNVTVNYSVSFVSGFLAQAANWSGSTVPTLNLKILVSTPYEVPL